MICNSHVTGTLGFVTTAILALKAIKGKRGSWNRGEVAFRVGVHVKNGL